MMVALNYTDDSNKQEQEGKNIYIYNERGDKSVGDPRSPVLISMMRIANNHDISNFHMKTFHVNAFHETILCGYFLYDNFMCIYFLWDNFSYSCFPYGYFHLATDLFRIYYLVFTKSCLKFLFLFHITYFLRLLFVIIYFSKDFNFIDKIRKIIWSNFRDAKCNEHQYVNLGIVNYIRLYISPLKILVNPLIFNCYHKSLIYFRCTSIDHLQDLLLVHA